MRKIIYLLIIASVLYSQTVDPNEVLQKTKQKINSVEDYQVEAVIKIDVNFLRVPETHATIYFKQPDKIKMESTGFALLPRQGLNFSPANLLKDEYTSVFAKEDIINKNPVYLIKILPLSDSSEVVLSNLWIDKNKFIVYKIETTTKKSGTVTIDIKYGEQIEHALPSELRISFKVDQMNLPPGMTGEFESNQETQKEGKMEGTVIVQYENYRVNIGLKDEFFIEEEKSKRR
ncbi:MAG: hypothetical protein M5R37_05455 [Melioribacteraceae bacterium]|nr:hypothetical protein [Melioribacteraceae bacterium]